MTREAGAGVVRRLERPANAMRKSLRRMLDEIPESAGADDWDGEGARAVAPRTVEIAKSVLAELPGYILAPEFDPDVWATPRGEVDFDWAAPCDAMFTISVGPTGRIVFVCTLGDEERVSGSGPWNGDLPAYIGDGFRRLRDCLGK